MDKKSVSATILILFLAIFFSMIGICFSTFVFKQTRTLVKAVKIKSSEGINVFSNKQLTHKINALKLSNMDVGLKPATGEIDPETQIPSTIDDKGTSEGYYSTVYVQASSDFKIVLENIVIESDHDEILIDEEKKNIFIAIMDLANSAKTLENNNTEIARFTSVSSVQEITFLIWLGSQASDELEGANISFDINFIAI